MKKEYYGNDHFPLSPCRQKKQHMNGEPEIKHSIVFISSLLEQILKTPFHTELILLIGTFS